MPLYRLNAPFGDVLLELEASSATILVDDATMVPSGLPNGMRVDDCRLHSASVDCEVGDEFSIKLGFETHDGWVAEYATGEGLDAIEFKHSGYGVAALGMRDPKWLCNRFALVYLDASSIRSGSNALAGRYKALSRTKVEVQAACAWTSKPRTEREADSPLFAVDLVMTF